MKYKIFLSMGLAGLVFSILTGLQGLAWLYQGTIRAGGPGYETVAFMIYVYFMVAVAGMAFATMFYIMDNEVRNWRPWQKLEWVGWRLCGTHFDRKQDPNTLKIYRGPFIYDLVFDGVNFRINRRIQDGVELLHHRFDKRIHPKELKKQLIQAIDSDFYGTPPLQTPKDWVAFLRNEDLEQHPRVDEIGHPAWVVYPVQRDGDGAWVAASVHIDGGYSIPEFATAFYTEEECAKACDIHNEWSGYGLTSDAIISASMNAPNLVWLKVREDVEVTYKMKVPGGLLDNPEDMETYICDNQPPREEWDEAVMERSWHTTEENTET